MAADDHRWAERLADVCSRLDLDGIRFTIEQAITEARGKECRKAEQEIDELRKQRDELKAQVERLTYELERWKEVDANKPDWEKLWEEQSEKVEALEAQVERLIAKEGDRIAKVLNPIIKVPGEI
jgi:DNA repair ATPase RecN